MRTLLTGYAGAFNRRHRRSGHLFQNRDQAVVGEEEPYFLERIRYLHLNPGRAGVGADLRALDRYPWSGHPALVGRRPALWQAAATAEVRGRFAPIRRRAQARYRAFVAQGLGQGRRPELQGGGLVRRAGGWAAVRALRRGREALAADERILGGSDFGERMRAESHAARPPLRRSLDGAALIGAVCRVTGAAPEAGRGGGRRPVVCRTREGLAYVWVDALSRSGRQLAEALGIRPESVYTAARRGAAHPAQWGRVLDTLP